AMPEYEEGPPPNQASTPGPMSKGRLRRTAPLAGLAGRTAGEAVIARLRKNGKDPADFHASAALRYAELLGQSKGVLMKAGQILSFVALGTAVPAEYQTIYQATLARLQDSAPPMPAAEAAAVVEAELGVPPEKAFAEFQPEPLAAASIGQVHEARLHDGREVAVKIQYPGVDEAIRADLANTELLATFFSLARTVTPNLGRVDVRALSREVTERIGEEIDYRAEACNQADFAAAYRGHPFIRVPEVVPELSTRRVFTMELVRGRRWSDAVSADATLRDRWGEAIYRFAFGSLRRLRLFNADPHPGNYLFHDDGTVTFLDYGCVKRFAPEHIATMQGIVRAGVDSDPAGLFQVLRRAGFVDPADAPAPGELLDWFQVQLGALIAPQPFTYTPEHAAAVIQSEYSPFGQYSGVTQRIRLHPEYLMITRIDLGLTSVLGALRATGQWAAICDEWDRGGPPATPMGVADVAFWEGRA
ncbi:MAG: AarF/ABC1/UbiB kinase family protein, partial [Actinobacteria bacterium]|nr:AarF/ABC1/UbiB kinase family protein [Actinomycetota bacterium]